MKKHIITKFLFITIGFIAMFFTIGDFDIAYAEEAKDLDWAARTQDLSTATRKFLYPVLMMIGALLENDLLFGGGMETVLNNIWIPIRNLVNILFILVLVGVALYNVLGLGEEGGEYAIKTALPKIIAALIVINFSFLGMKVLLDGVNALTISILALPTEMGQTPDKSLTREPTVNAYCEGIFAKANFRSKDGKLLDQQQIKDQMKLREYQAVAESKGVTMSSKQKKYDEVLPEVTAYITKNNITSFTKDGVEAEAKAMEDQRHCAPLVNDPDAATTDASGTKTESSKGFELTTLGKSYFAVFNSRNAAMVLALNFNKLGYLDIPDYKIENSKDILMNALFSLIIYITLAASFFALFFVLLFRIVFLWVAIAISPILVLLLFSPTIKEKLGGGVGEIADKFIKNAFAPVPVALALTVGFIMLKSVQTSFNATTTTLGMSPVLSLPVTGLSTPQDLIVMIGTIAVIWMGVFGAAEGTLAEGITGKIKDGVQKVGTGLATLPIKHMPTGMKAQDGTEIKAGHLPSILGQASDKINAPMSGVANKMFGTPTKPTTSDLSGLNKDNARDILRRVTANKPENMSSKDKTALNTALNKLKDKDEAVYNSINGLSTFHAALHTARGQKADHKDSKAIAAASADLRTAVGGDKSAAPGKIFQNSPTRDDRTRTARSGSSSTTAPARDLSAAGGITTLPPKATLTPVVGGGAAKEVDLATSGTQHTSNKAAFDKLIKITTLSGTTTEATAKKIGEHVNTIKIKAQDGQDYVPTANIIKDSMKPADYNRLVGTDGHQPFLNDEALQKAIDENK